jgi:rSAM/selenodomain-associated transferase 2
VVIPTLNEESTIQACLDSVGSDPSVELIVSDGGSEDATVDVVGSRPGVLIVRGPPGRGGQLNRGARRGTGAVLLFLHADCRLPSGWQNALQQALRDPDTVLTCFRLRTEGVGPPGRQWSWRASWLRLLDLRSRLPALPYGDQGFGIRRQDFEALGGFPEIPLMEDLALARDCRRRGRITRLPLELRTTGRRFQQHPLRTRLMTASFPLLFRLGVSPARLADWYGQVR